MRARLRVKVRVRVRVRVRVGVRVRLREGVREREALEVLDGEPVQLVAPEVRTRGCNPKYQRLQP